MCGFNGEGVNGEGVNGERGVNGEGVNGEGVSGVGVSMEHGIANTCSPAFHDIRYPIGTYRRGGAVREYTPHAIPPPSHPQHHTIKENEKSIKRVSM